jgi:WD40 repeat protein
MANVSEYERKRLENISKNNELLLQLGLASEPKTAAASKEPRPKKKVKLNSNAPRRVSLRNLNKDPEALEKEVPEQLPEPTALTIKFERNEFLDHLKEMNKREIKWATERDESSDFSLSNPIPFNGSVKVTKDMIVSIECHPSSQKILAMVGSKKGELALWDISDTLEKSLANPEATEQVDPVVVSFKPHRGPIAKIIHDKDDLNHVYTSSFDGSIKMLDLERQTFESVYESDDKDPIAWIDISGHSMWHCTHSGYVGHLDLRSNDCVLHVANSKKLNTVHINPINSNYFVTAGLDNFVNIFDIRNLKVEDGLLVQANSFKHGKSVNSAFWDPIFGNDIVSMSFDDTIGIWKNALDAKSSHIAIAHNNDTGRWVQKFKAYWRPYGMTLKVM